MVTGLGFWRFLAVELERFETNPFLDPAICRECLPGFRAFILTRTLELSRDFATRTAAPEPQARSRELSRF